MAKFTKKIRNLIEQLDWTIISEDNDTISLEWFDSCDGDFVIDLNKANIVQNAMNAYDNYDLDEEVMIYLEAKKNGFAGVPSVCDLVECIKERDAKLEELWMELNKVCA